VFDNAEKNAVKKVTNFRKDMPWYPAALNKQKQTVIKTTLYSEDDDIKDDTTVLS
jgi:hypothetical protein